MALGSLGKDVRYGIRMLRRNPGFSAVAALSLGLGIGANTAIFSLLDRVMLPVREPQQLVIFRRRAVPCQLNSRASLATALDSAVVTRAHGSAQGKSSTRKPHLGHSTRQGR